MEDNKNLILDIKDLVIHYETDDGVVEAVNGIDIQLEHGSTLGLVGETGSGKTTTALSILRLVPDPPGVIKNGSILLDGKDILNMPQKELEAIRGNTVSMIFQDPMTSLNPLMPVGKQIMEGMIWHYHTPKEEAYEKALELMKLVGITDAEKRIKNYPHQLSGGMLQRIMIGIAMALQPELLIADEPTTAIDAITQYEILEEFIRIKKSKNTAMLFITHDLGAISKVADRILVMNSGQIVDSGDFEHIRNHANDPYTRLLIEKRSAVMCHYRDILHGKEISHAGSK